MLEALRTGPLAGRVAVVSGGGRGLGRSFCLALARQGAMVVVNNRNRVVDADGHGPADHVADQITAAGGEAVTEYSDAADPGAGQAMVAAALRRWGRLDICVANAAIGVGGMFHKQPSQGCRLNGEYIVTGSSRLRRASVVEWGTVPLPDDPDLRAEELETLLARSHAGEPKEFRVSVDAFDDLMDGGSR